MNKKERERERVKANRKLLKNSSNNNRVVYYDMTTESNKKTTGVTPSTQTDEAIDAAKAMDETVKKLDYYRNEVDALHKALEKEQADHLTTKEKLYENCLQLYTALDAVRKAMDEWHKAMTIQAAEVVKGNNTITQAQTGVTALAGPIKKEIDLAKAQQQTAKQHDDDEEEEEGQEQ